MVFQEKLRYVLTKNNMDGIVTTERKVVYKSQKGIQIKSWIK